MRRWTARAVMPVVVAIATLGVAQAQEPAGGRRTLTALDYAEIQLAGLYEDVLVKTPQGWRFKLRVYTSILNLQREASPPPTR